MGAMYSEHPSFRPPPDSTPLFRYLTFKKLDSLLKGQLFFSRADTFEDKFEGYVNPCLFPNALPSFLGLLPNLSAFTLVSCWSKNRDSADLWRGYTKHGGVCIHSTVGRLKQCLHTVENSTFYIGSVNYLPGSSENWEAKQNMFCHFLRKQESYSVENEVRAVTFEGRGVSTGPNGDRLIKSFSFGMMIPVDLKVLVEGISLSPGMPSIQRIEILSVLESAGLRVPVFSSGLDDKPDWSGRERPV